MTDAEPPLDQANERQKTADVSRRSNHIAIIVLLSAASLYAVVQLRLNPRYVSDPQPALPDRARELADRIDPNTAEASALSALPQVGEKRARELIAFRERTRSRQKDGIVFHRSLDLLRVPGFGPSLANQMEPYLIFPSTAPTSSPSVQ